MLSFPPRTQIEADHEVRCFRWQHVLGAARGTRVPAEARGARNGDVPLIEVRGLGASYGQRQVLFDIDLCVGPGACVALVGESGSGKTTLARCVGGLHRELHGEMYLRGAPLPVGARARDRQTRRQIQYVFQSPYASLNPRRTIGQIVAQPIRIFERLRGSDVEKKVVEALDRVALGGSVVDRYPDQLSGGERQRVAIARAIATTPAVLICDEVTSALDVSVQAAIVELIEELRRDLGLGLLFVTHNLALISTIADEVAVMSEGRIVEHGPVRKVLDTPQASYTQKLLADTPTVEAAV